MVAQKKIGKWEFLDEKNRKKWGGKNRKICLKNRKICLKNRKTRSSNSSLIDHRQLPRTPIAYINPLKSNIFNEKWIAWCILFRLLHISLFKHFQQNTSTPLETKLKIWNETVTLFSLPAKIQDFLQNLKLDSYALWSSSYTSLQCFQQNTSIHWKQNLNLKLNQFTVLFLDGRSQWQCLFQQLLFLHAPYIFICLCFSSTSSSFIFALSWFQSWGVLLLQFVIGRRHIWDTVRPIGVSPRSLWLWISAKWSWKWCTALFHHGRRISSNLHSNWWMGATAGTWETKQLPSLRETPADPVIADEGRDRIPRNKRYLTVPQICLRPIPNFGDSLFSCRRTLSLELLLAPWTASIFHAAFSSVHS